MAARGLAGRAARSGEGVVAAVLLAIPFGVALGLAVGTLGGGGSVLAVPVLVYVLGEDVQTATTISLVVVAAAAFAGGYGHARKRRVCWRHAAVFTAAAVPGVIVGTVLANAVGDQALLGGFAVVMLAAAAATWRKASDQSEPADDDATGHICPAVLVRRDVGAGLVVGLLTGFFGVGGGFIIVPTLAVALAFSMRSAIGTALVIMTTTSVLGVVVHLGIGRSLDVDLTVAMATACAVGAVGGARLSSHVPQQTLARAFAGLVVAVAGYLLVSVALLGGPPSG